ncbi:MAG: YheC/YheD family protein [Alicyclobacillus mali]|uniref:YheC/YheD family endospore coat-associated protein n=1 Tax=Alicyclobacillus mali (ex Roth et al. 2021) TaxID=1123961 RepID=UPI0023F3C0E7|nr:YheC/YheD family protein [Alicyclobacillus mali (ex Roth et al. 2021)]MCL6487967.1 YheC/YheD family protein [Alicyclobacillus mali (ex Roth et al. 2021)]
MADYPDGLWLGIASTAVPRDGRRRWRPGVHYRRIARAARRHGMRVCLFDPGRQAEWSRISAYVPVDSNRPDGDWEPASLRFPDVIYENVYVHLAVKGYSAALRAQARRRGVPLFNPMLPGKWQMVGFLRRAQLHHLVPETEMLTTADALWRALERWRIVYVKPSGGYGGVNVHRLELLADGHVRMRADRRGGRVRAWERVVDRRRLADFVQSLRGRYLVQRGLRLFRVNGRRVDFRVVLHRDHQGEWQLIGIVPKMAAPDGVVTNIIAGGERWTLEKLESAAKREGKEVPVGDLVRAAKSIAEALSRRYETVGLVGFDMAVEEDGHVWMIEMNPKPARSLLDRSMLEKLAACQAGFAHWLAHR